MQDITVQRTALVAILKENRKKHEDAYTSALAAYRAAAIQELKNNLATAQSNGPIVRRLEACEPQTFVKDYNRAIGMLELCTDDEIELSEHDYSQFVEDQWGWSGQFATTTMSYNAKT